MKAQAFIYVYRTLSREYLHYLCSISLGRIQDFSLDGGAALRQLRLNFFSSRNTCYFRRSQVISGSERDADFKNFINSLAYKGA